MRADDLTPEEQQRRIDQLQRLRDRHAQLMREAKEELDRAMAEGQLVRVAGFIRSCKGRKRRKAS